MKDRNLFQLNAERIPGFDALGQDDFSPASAEEKAAMVENRASVSYWRDAARRFKANRVSMAALVLFLLIFLFSYLGPVFIPYNYSDQYRGSGKLGPGEYSKAEQIIKKAEGRCDGFFATSLIPGSLTNLGRNTTYWFRAGGVTYSFYNEKAVSNAVVLFTAGADNPLMIISEEDLDAGALDRAVPLAYSTGPVDTKDLNTREIRLQKRVFPHVFGTDSSGRDLMARTMYGGRVSIAVGIIAALIVLIIGSIYGSVSGLAGAGWTS